MSLTAGTLSMSYSPAYYQNPTISGRALFSEDGALASHVQQHVSITSIVDCHLWWHNQLPNYLANPVDIRSQPDQATYSSVMPRRIYLVPFLPVHSHFCLTLSERGAIVIPSEAWTATQEDITQFQVTDRFGQRAVRQNITPQSTNTRLEMVVVKGLQTTLFSCWLVLTCRCIETCQLTWLTVLACML